MKGTVLKPPIPSYRGESDYAFVSYSHLDAEVVFAEIEWLSEQGVNIWYDEGIEVGENWHEELARAIRNCETFLFYVSERSIHSRHCQREVNFALSMDRQVVVVHLESTELPDWIQFSLGDRQAILKSQFAEGRYREKLLGALAPAAEPVAAPTRVRSAPHNLPDRHEPLVGRERELAQVCEMIQAHRLTSLVGTGGAGKTRLATEAAREFTTLLRDGVWIVSLADLESGALVAQHVARALSVAEMAGRSMDDSLLDFLRSRELLLVLDNCEHLIDDASRLASAILSQCPGVRLLATSREPLQVAGEHRFAIRPLAVEMGEDDTTPPAAAELFATRARAVQSSFVLDAESLPHVLSICRRVDGIPLAIELAAARCAVMSVADMAQRLSESFRALGRGRRDTIPHHQTLRATLEWSYRLLDEDEQALLRRLSVFRGGFDLSAAEAVCGGDAVDGYDIMDLLDQLTNKSLVQARTEGEHSRFEALETVRDFAADKLREEGRHEAVAQRHRSHFLELAEKASQALQAAPAAWVKRLNADQGNFRAALRASLECDDGTAALRLVGSLAYYWVLSGSAPEKRNWFEQALGYVEGADAETRGRALFGAGMSAALDADYTAADGWLAGAADAFGELGHQAGVAWVRFWQGRTETAKVFTGVSPPDHLDQARAHYKAALDWFAAHNDGFGQTLTLAFSAWADQLARRPDAIERIDQAIAAASAAGLERGEMVSRAHKANLLADQGDVDTALETLDQCIEVLGRLGDELNRQICVCLAGLIALRVGRREEALRRARDAVQDTAGLRAREWEPMRLALAAFVLEDHERRESATLLCGALDRMLPTWCVCIAHCGLPDAEDRQRKLREPVSPSQREQLELEGRRMTVGDAIAYARRALARIDAGDGHSSQQGEQQ